MTFTEAALEVLRSAGEPLHYKKITELAIARNLLSHVGKTPEVTMSSRLATLVKKDRGQSGLVKVRPGVFAVREPHMPSENDPQPIAAEPSPELEAPPVTVPPRVARPPMPGADVFPEEEGDDDPILAGVEDAGGSQDERGRRRRRRRRRGKGGEGDEAPIEAAARPAVRPEESGPRLSGRPERERQPPRDDRGRDTRGRDDRGPIDRARDDRGRDHGRRDERGRDDRGRDGRDGRGRDDRGPIDRPRDDRGRDFGRREERPELDLSRQPGDGDLLGKDLADAAYSVLVRGERAPASFARVAESLVQRGRLTGSPEALAPTVAAALRADAARAARNHMRPRFRLVDQRVSLTEWLMPRDVVRCEENVENAAEQQRDQVRRAFVNRLNDLPTAGFAEIIATWLNAEGLISLRAVRRPGSSGRELHLAGTMRRGAEETRLAVVVLRSGRDVERDMVVEVRGSMHHYGGATAAWLVTTARVAPGAREEGAAEHAAPCALLGGQDLARSMERLGIGLRQHFMPLCDIDFDLLEALGDAGLRRERNQRDDVRPRRDDEGRDHGRDGRETRPAREERTARTGQGDTRGPGAGLDLLDADAAEASRLVPEARSWNDEGEEGEEGEEGDAEAAETALEAADGEEAAEGEGAEGAEAAASEEDAELDFDRDRDEPLEEIDDGSDDEGADDEEENEEESGEGADDEDADADADADEEENGEDESEEEDD